MPQGPKKYSVRDVSIEDCRERFIGKQLVVHLPFPGSLCDEGEANGRLCSLDVTRH